jgi:hypothetical protein
MPTRELTGERLTEEESLLMWRGAGLSVSLLTSSHCPIAISLCLSLSLSLSLSSIELSEIGDLADSVAD